MKATELWPSRSETTFGLTPAASSRVAWVCLKSCLCRHRHNHDLRHTHGIERLASASRLEQLHAQAHRAEGTAWHRAWYVDPADAPEPNPDDRAADDRAADAQEAEW